MIAGVAACADRVQTGSRRTTEKITAIERLTDTGTTSSSYAKGIVSRRQKPVIYGWINKAPLVPVKIPGTLYELTPASPLKTCVVYQRQIKRRIVVVLLLIVSTYWSDTGAS
jgi:hypothetical protein